MNANRLRIRATGTAGMLTLVLAVVIMVTFPGEADLPEGYHTPIIAFEFAQTIEDLAYLTTASLGGERNRKQMISGLQWDMLFPFAYGGFLFLILLRGFTSTKSIALIGMPAALMIIPLDLYENTVLLRILAAIDDGAPVETHLDTLFWATWLKWAAIALSLLAVALMSLKEAKIWTAGVTAAAAFSTALCWLSGTLPILAESMSLVIALSFVWLIVREIRQAFFV